MMGSKAKAALNRLKQIDEKYKYNKQDKLFISSDSSRSSNEDKGLRPILNIKLPDPYEEYADSNTDESERVVVKVVDDTPRSRQSSHQSSKSSVKSRTEVVEMKTGGDGVELSGGTDEISEIIEDVSETVQEVTDKSLYSSSNLDNGEESAEEEDGGGKRISDEILTDKYSDSFESSGTDESESESKSSIILKPATDNFDKNFNKSKSSSDDNKSVEKSNSSTDNLTDNYTSDKNLMSILSSEEKIYSLEEISDKENKNIRNEVEKNDIEKKLSIESIKLSDIIEDTDENKKLSSSEVVESNIQSCDSFNVESKKTEKKSSRSKSEKSYSSSESAKSSSRESSVKFKKKADTRQTVSDHELNLSSKKKCSRSSSNKSLEEKMKRSHLHFKQEQHRLNSAMINYIQKMEEEHQRLVMWPKNFICPSRVNLKTIKPLELPNISGFTRPGMWK